MGTKQRRIINRYLSHVISLVLISVVINIPASAEPKISKTSDVINVTKSDPEKSKIGIRNPNLPENLMDSGQVEIDPNRIIVSYKVKPIASQASALRLKYNVEKSTPIEINGKSTNLYAEVWHTKPSAKSISLNAIKSEAGIKSVQHDLKLKISALPNDPSYSQTWGMGKINAPTAWNYTTGSANVVVAVIDTGIDLDHPDLVNNLWTNVNEIPNNNIDDDNNGYIDDIHGWDFVDDDGTPNDDVAANHWAAGHGTHVAGTIAGVGNNQLGVAGVAWQAKLMGLRICGPYGCYLSDHVLALAYAYANGAEIANESFGGNYRGYDFEREALIAVAEPGDTPLKKGVLVVAAAGNSAVDTDQTPFHPANYRLNNLVSVAATSNNAENQLAGFSNYGVSGVDVAAPGEQIFSTLPEGAFNTTGGYGFLSGTSMAAPHTAGLAVLIKARFPTLTAAQLRLAIVGSVTEYPALKSKIFSGGLIDAAKAVTLAGVPSPKIHLKLVGTGFGSLASSIGNCDQADCIYSLTSNSLTLTATAAAGSTLKSWHTPNCTASQNSCSFTNFGVSPVIKVKFSGAASLNATETALLSSESTPVFTGSSSPDWGNLVNSQLSADGLVRAKAVFRQPENSWCYYAYSETGGITVEEKVNGNWTELAKFTAPYVDGNEPRDRWANCGHFGEEMHLSKDGKTLAVGLGINFYPDINVPANDYLKCGAAIYRKINNVWTYLGVAKPADKYDCIHIFSRDANGMAYQFGFGSMSLSADGNKLFVGSVKNLRVFDITNFNSIIEYEYQLTNNCEVTNSTWNNWQNISVSNSGNLILVPTRYCSNGSAASLISFQNGTFQTIRNFAEIDSRTGRHVYSVAISPNGTTLAVSYNGNQSGVMIFENISNTWTFRHNLNTTTGFTGYTNCFQFDLTGSKLICDAQFTDIGRNSQQGKLILVSRVGNSWSAGAVIDSFWMAEGNSYDWVQFLAADETLTIFDVGISGNSIGNGSYSNNVMGATFTYNPIGPLNLIKPNITGSNIQGSTLTASSGTWQSANPITYSYRWLRCDQINDQNGCTVITGATNTSYQTSAADNGKYLRIEITATANNQSRSAISEPTSQIATTPAITSTINLTASLAVGQVIAASAPTVGGSPVPSLSYQWLSCTARDTRQVTSTPTGCVVISGATSQTYVLNATDIGRYLRVAVKAENAASAVWAYSPTTRATIAAAPIAITAPSITGSLVVGQTLTGRNGNWQSSPTARYVYAWMRCSNAELTSCQTISGATRTSYRLVAADAGSMIRFQVVASNSVGSTSAVSASTNQVAGAPSLNSTISITGSARIGQTITAQNIIWSGFPTPSVTYQWYSCSAQNRTQTNRSVRNCSPIANANQIQYTITAAEFNRFLLITTTATNSTGSVTIWSVSTSRVTN